MATAPAPTPTAIRASYTSGILLFVLGLVGTMVGGMLSGLCFLADGIICAGTSIGSMGNAILVLGLPALILGIVLTARTRRAYRADVHARSAVLQAERSALLARTLQADAEVARRGLEPARGPIASQCPKCGGPVDAAAIECEWCGQPYL